MDKSSYRLKKKGNDLKSRVKEIRKEYKDELLLVTEGIVFVAVVWEIVKRVKKYFSKEECYEEV